MRTNLVKTLTQFGLFTVLAMVATSSSVSGQSLAERLKANIPFEFTIQDHKLPAGEYVIGRALPSSGDLILEITSLAGRESAFATSAVQSLSPKRKATLVFHRYGDEYFLIEIWPGGKTGRAIPKSHREQEIERQGRGPSGTPSEKTTQREIVSIAVDSHLGTNCDGSFILAPRSNHSNRDYCWSQENA